MPAIDEDIKSRSFSHIYLLYGEERYLVNYYKDKLIKALLPEGDTMNYSVFAGNKLLPEPIIDAAETMPFFAEHRVILVENSGFFKSANDKLADYLKELPETAYLIFVEEEVDKRGRMYKGCDKSGRCFEFKNPTEEELVMWAAGVLKRDGRKIRQSTLLKLFERSGTDMNCLSTELEKLISYTAGRDTVEDADIEAICHVEVRNRIFDMIDAMAEGRQKYALSLYYDLLTLKEAPLKILALIARQFELLMRVKELSGHIRSNKIIAEKTGLKPFIAGKYMDRSRAFSSKILRRAVEECVELEMAVKTGKLQEKMSVELLIIKYSKAAGSRNG